MQGNDPWRRSVELQYKTARMQVRARIRWGMATWPESSAVPWCPDSIGRDRRSFTIYIARVLAMIEEISNLSDIILYFTVICEYIELKIASLNCIIIVQNCIIIFQNCIIIFQNCIIIFQNSIIIFQNSIIFQKNLIIFQNNVTISKIILLSALPITIFQNSFTIFQIAVSWCSDSFLAVSCLTDAIIKTCQYFSGC